MRVVAVVGRSRAGKTTLIERLIRTLGRKARIAVVKHSHHREIDLDVRGKDTWRFARAGATAVLGVSQHRVILTSHRTLSLAESVRLLSRETPRPDWVFVEGFHDEVARNRRIPAVVVARTSTDLAEVTRGRRSPPLAVLSRHRLPVPPSIRLCRGVAEIVEVLRRLPDEPRNRRPG